MLAGKLIDLSTPIRTEHFRWPVERRLLKSHAGGHESEATWAGWNVHAFTHMDAPRHVVAEGGTTSSVPLEATLGEAAILDLSDVPDNSPVELDQVIAAAPHLRRGDIAILKTRWDERRSIDTPEFWSEAPWMTAPAAEWLHDRGIKAVGFDFPQDYCIRYFLTGQARPPLPEHVTHYHLLARGVIMLEYLRNTGALTAPRCTIVALPISLPDADGAPARVIAVEEPEA